MYYTYLLVSNLNEKSYVGSTSKNPIERLEEHNNGTNEFTKVGRPWKLVYYEQYACKKCSLLRETFLKSGVGNKLVKLIKENY